MGHTLIGKAFYYDAVPMMNQSTASPLGDLA
jgi:hypothetical protein